MKYRKTKRGLGLVFVGFLLLFSNFELAISDELAVVGELAAEKKDSEIDGIDVLAMLKKRENKLKGVTAKKVGNIVLLSSSSRCVGYCFVENKLEKIDFGKYDLSNVDKIEFGDPSIVGGRGIKFVISDHQDILVWVSVLKKHTAVDKKIVWFIPIVKDAGFEETSVEIDDVSGCGCNRGVYFYRNEKEILNMPSHLSENASSKESWSNKLMKSLILDRLKNNENK